MEEADQVIYFSLIKEIENKLKEVEGDIKEILEYKASTQNQINEEKKKKFTEKIDQIQVYHELLANLKNIHRIETHDPTLGSLLRLRNKLLEKIVKQHNAIIESLTCLNNIKTNLDILYTDNP